MRRPAVPVVLLLACLGGAACRDGGASVLPSTTVPPVTAPPVTVPAAPAPVAPPAELLAAGDIAVCGLQGDEATADVVAAHPGAAVAAVGDLVYTQGTAAEFRDCYDPTWGRFKDRTHPAPGNHDYGTGQADGYFGYWGAAAGPAGKGWYSYEVGSWHVVALNSNCGIVGCGPESEQGRWLAADLAAHAGAACSLAYWHHPRWSSGPHGSSTVVDPLWKAAVAGRVDVVLSGHDHDYERFGLIDGIRSFVVGTGGASRYGFGPNVAPGSEVRESGPLGVLGLTLRAGSYDWRFLSAAGGAFADSGTGTCH
ncbi:MAG TPA: metallophosphoesterase [Acidimicrobiales bacterium]|jgi:hypothetical protein|nr:metallophosphoesterase [Acidimicrobiales bacterium]